MMKKAQGLCSTCAHTPECALTPVKKALQGVQFCEEYETVHVVAAGPSNGKQSKKPIRRTSPGILGLCCNCGHYPGCNYPKPQAGVWHCEDYL
jgi:hypothetical protein